MSEHSNNPAGRLFLILEKGIKIDKQTKMRQAWAEILEVKPSNTSELLRKIGKVNNLPSEIRSNVKSLDGENHELYLKRLDKIESALGSLNFGSNWTSFLNKLDDTTIATLEFTSDLLSKNTNEELLSMDDLREMVKKIQDFKNELVDSKFPEVLKKFIIERLNDIENAIYDYKISGVKPIEVAIERSVGSFVMRRGIYSMDTSWTKKFFKLITKLSTYVSFANESQTLIGDAIKFLKD